MGGAQCSVSKMNGCFNPICMVTSVSCLFALYKSVLALLCIHACTHVLEMAIKLFTVWNVEQPVGLPRGHA